MNNLSHAARLSGGILASRLLGRDRLLSVQVMLLFPCNLSCAYCSAPHLKDILKLEEVEQILRDLKRRGTLQISYAGGEPTLHPKYREIIRMSREMGFYITVSTHGYKNAKHFRGPVEEMPHLVSVSLDGPEGEHERYRGKGTWGPVMETLRELAPRKDLARALNAVIGAHNCTIENIRWLHDRAEELSASLNFQFMLPAWGEHPSGANVHAPSMEQVRKLIGELLAMPRRERRRLILGDEVLEQYKEWDALYPFYRTREGKTCYAGRNFAYISATGRLSPCSLVEEHPWYSQCTAVGEGAERSYEEIKKLPCNDCYLGCNALRNNLYGLNPRTIGGAIRMVLGR